MTILCYNNIINKSKGEKMLKILAQGLLTISLFISVVNAQNLDSEDIIDVVDYKLNRIKNNLGSELQKIKAELAELKSIKNNENIEQEINTLDRSIETLETNIAQATITKETLQEKFTKYDDIISSNTDTQLWVIGFIVLFMVFVYFIVNTYIKKLKSEMEQKMEAMLHQETSIKESMDTEGIEKNTNFVINKMELDILNILSGERSIKLIKKRFDILRKKYENRETSRDILRNELQSWIETVQEKKIRKKVGSVLSAL